MEKEQMPGQENEKKPLTIKELAKKHMQDPNHATTDEELKNAALELTGNVEPDQKSLHEADNTTVIPPMDFEKAAEEDAAKDEDDNDDKGGFGSGKTTPPNPYDVLGKHG